ncbi:unnamed protein product [Tenebrio molitor]|nr:unnamed protein product [Tenebrio molitor]
MSRSLCFLFLASKILANPDLNGRIIGGTPAHVYKLPYQVSLQNEEGHMCGGSIIHKSYILTAAHCLIGEKKLSIRAGSDFHEKGGTVRQVCAVTIHNKYNDDKEDYDYDIAILKLCQDLPLGDKILPVALPTFNEIIKDGTPVLTSGWGYTEKNVLSPQLLQVALVTVNQTTCRNNYKGVGVITGRMFCAGCKNKLCDSCQGDSGGPLFANRKLMGVVSWGYGCAMKDFPGVYTKVAKFRKWIRKEIKI